MSLTSIMSDAVSVLVSLQHIGIFALETLLFRSKGARAVFARTKEGELHATSPIMAQLGVYNFFLAFGVMYAVAKQDPYLKFIHLTYVIWAAAFGCGSYNYRLIFAQGAPAVLAWCLALQELRDSRMYEQIDEWSIICWVGAVVLGLLGHLWKKRENSSNNEQKEAERNAGVETAKI